MTNVTIQEIELLATVLQRARMTKLLAIFIDSVLDRLRVQATLKEPVALYGECQ